MSAVRHLIAGELIKLLTLPAARRMTLVLLAAGIYLDVQASIGLRDSLSTLDANGLTHAYITGPVNAEADFLGSLGTDLLTLATLLTPALGAFVAGSEFRSGQIGLSVLTAPRRWRLVAAKALALAAHTLVLGVLLALVSTASTWWTVRDWRPELLVRAEAVERMAGGVALMVATALLGLALTLVARRTLAGIVALVVFALITTTQALAVRTPLLDALTPLSAARNALLQTGYAVSQAGGAGFSSAPLAGWLVVAAWVLGSLTVAAAALRRRDVP